MIAMHCHFLLLPFPSLPTPSPLAARSAAVAMGTMPQVTPSLPVPGDGHCDYSAVTGNQSQQVPAQVVQPPIAVSNQMMAPTSVLLDCSVTVAPNIVQSSASVSTSLAGLLMGGGLAPLQQKPIQRIVQLEFIEMADLLP